VTSIVTLHERQFAAERNETMDINKQTMHQWKRYAVPIARLTDHPSGLADEFRVGFKMADVIIGYEVSSPLTPASFVLFYGRGFLQDVANGGKGDGMNLFVVAYDETTNELEALSALCLVHRGASDYERSARSHVYH
jgi:hypothetical protein